MEDDEVPQAPEVMRPLSYKEKREELMAQLHYQQLRNRVAMYDLNAGRRACRRLGASLRALDETHAMERAALRRRQNRSRHNAGRFGRDVRGTIQAPPLGDVDPAGERVDGADQ